MNEAFNREFTVAASHPSLAGHFPGHPVIPAVVLLDLVLASIQAQGAFVLQSIPAAKFRKPVLPGERVELRVTFTPLERATVRASFQGTAAASVAFEGSFVLHVTPAP